MSVPGPIREAIDLGLEASIVGSFTSIGYRARSAAFGWRELDDYRLDGATVVVTGATSGLGRAAALQLAKQGATVVVGGRDEHKLDETVHHIWERTRSNQVMRANIDLGDLSKLTEVGAYLRQTYPQIHALIHNAGALTHDRQITADGLELTSQVHVVGQHLLTKALMPALTAKSSSRVITVSSGGMYAQPLELDALFAVDGPYDGVRQYARAKRAQVLLNREWAKQRPDGPVFHAMHPGWADTPGVVDSLPGFHKLMGPLLRSPDEGMDTMVWLASAPEALTDSGKFWIDRHRRGIVKVPWTRTPAEEVQQLWHTVDGIADRYLSAPAHS